MAFANENDARIYLHIELEGEIQSLVVTRDACGNILQCQVWTDILLSACDQITHVTALCGQGHSESMVSTVTLNKKVQAAKLIISWGPFCWGICMFSLFLCGFPPGTLVPCHKPLTCESGDAVCSMKIKYNLRIIV